MQNVKHVTESPYAAILVTRQQLQATRIRAWEVWLEWKLKYQSKNITIAVQIRQLLCTYML